MEIWSMVRRRLHYYYLFVGGLATIPCCVCACVVLCVAVGVGRCIYVTVLGPSSAEGVCGGRAGGGPERTTFRTMCCVQCATGWRVPVCWMSCR